VEKFYLPGHHGEWIEQRIEEEGPVTTTFSPTIVHRRNGPVNDLKWSKQKCSSNLVEN